MNPEPRVYGIANCDTVKRARAWLQQQGVPFAFHDVKKLGVPPDRLQAWIDAVGWERLLNRQGTTWRKLDEGVKSAVAAPAAATALMTEQPSVIKRPVVEWPDGEVTVGFDPQDWQARIGAR